MTAFQTKITRMALLAVCSAALTAPLAVLAQDTPPLPPAQNGGGPGAGGQGGGRGDMAARMQEREARQLDMMTTQLSLTPDQVTAIKQINADSDAKMQAAFQSGGDVRSQMMALRTDREAKTRAILTPAQQPKFDEMMQRQRERMERGGGPGGPGGNGGGGTPPAPPPAQQ